jgi:hypothetical protein
LSQAYPTRLGRRARIDRRVSPLSYRRLDCPDPSSGRPRPVFVGTVAVVVRGIFVHLPSPSSSTLQGVWLEAHPYGGHEVMSSVAVKRHDVVRANTRCRDDRRVPIKWLARGILAPDRCAPRPARPSSRSRSP